MRTTIAIDEQLVDELMRVEPGVSRSEAIRRAIQDYLRRKRIEAFKRLAGSRIVDLDWREMERIEMEEVREDERRRQGARRHVGVDRLLRR
jgi:metal-responsive CopG/Arc/MetJ family transcriptional regulator